MAIVLDAARTAMNGGDFNTVYQKGNDYPDTPNPTWVHALAYETATAETHVTARADVTPWAAVNNTANAWVPHTTFTTLPSTPATVRSA